MGASYFSLARRVPESGALEPKALAWFYGLINRVPLAETIRRRFLAGALTHGVRQGWVLDLGTGPGHSAVEIAQYCPGVRMIGLDLAAHMVRQASRYAAHTRLGRPILWTHGDGHHLPYRDRTFDLVVSSFSLHHWSDPLSVLNEVARVLAPDGRYYITDLCRSVTVLQRLLSYASIPAISLPLGSYLGYGGYYESVRAAYTVEEAVDLVDLSALPLGHVWEDSARFIPVLTISSQATARQHVTTKAQKEIHLQNPPALLKRSRCADSSVRMRRMV